MNTYIVYRPYMRTDRVVVVAVSKKEARKLVEAKYGYADGARVCKVPSKSHVVMGAERY
jgi:hypothetical protein